MQLPEDRSSTTPFATHTTFFTTCRQSGQASYLKNLEACTRNHKKEQPVHTKTIKNCTELKHVIVITYHLPVGTKVLSSDPCLTNGFVGVGRSGVINSAASSMLGASSGSMV